PGVFWIQFGKLTQNFFRSLVPELRHNHLHSNNLVATSSLMGCRRNSLAAQPDSLAIAGAGFDANLNRFGAAHCSFAIAGGTFVLELARAATPRARDLELHPSTHLGDLSRALTFRTGSAAAAGFSFAGGAGLLPYYL